MVNKRKIIMDCDPGVDDAFAMAFASAHQDVFEMIGITSVSGNLPIEVTTENARRLSVFLGLADVPVAKGSPVPVVRAPLTAKEIHGSNGLGEVEIPYTDKELASENAVLFLKQLIDELPEGEKVTLVPTGPLTNVALFLRVFPEAKERIEEIVLMGGAAVGGNITPSGEFNIYEDPEAAAMVFDSGLPIVMCGLDVTEKSGLTREDADELFQSKGRVLHALGEMLQYYFNAPSNGKSLYVNLHDAHTFMYLLHPEIYKAVRMPVKVDCSEGLNRGATICDTRTWAHDGTAKTAILMEVDSARFREYMLESLRYLDK